MTALLVRAGFEVMRSDYAQDHLHIGYACRPGAPSTASLSDPARVHDLFREVRLVQNAPRRAVDS